jgi:cold shock CspA family protein
VGKSVRQRMRVLKYLPKQLFGFAIDDEGNQVFFHVRAFKWGKFDHTPPPIIGEEVEVEYEPGGSSNGRAPRARAVRRVNAPQVTYGVVEDFNEQRGYGFIKTSDGRSHYLHRSEMTDGRLPMPGMEVTFFEGFRQGRTRACYVTPSQGEKT